MVYKIKDIVSYLEQIAPPSYQESYDNAGLLTGNPQDEVKGIVLTLDCTEEVVEEAIQLGANLIIAHHPIIFGGLKKLTGRNYVERTVIKAIKHDVAIFATHTNLDAVSNGVNKQICDRIGLSQTKILKPKKDILSKLVTFVPKADTSKVLRAMFDAGAGQIGEYLDCSFFHPGTGTYTPSEKANPHIGERNQPHEEAEDRIEVLLPTHLEAKVLSALKAAHPYEEVAYFMHRLANENQMVGSGMIGELPEPHDFQEFILHLKERMQLKIVKHTHATGKPIKKVAVCGGSGIFLLTDAMNKGADVFITSDVKYHEFFDAEDQLVICDIGHYESEIFTKELLENLLSQKFTNIALYLSKVVTNPITYT